MPRLKEPIATLPVPQVAAELQDLQRRRSIVIKSRNMQANRLQAIVAGTLGYHSGMAEKERTKKFAEAAGRRCADLQLVTSGLSMSRCTGLAPLSGSS